MEVNYLANHSVKNLLNGDKTKFFARDIPVTNKPVIDKDDQDHFYISLKFPNKPE